MLSRYGPAVAMIPGQGDGQLKNNTNLPGARAIGHSDPGPAHDGPATQSSSTFVKSL